MRAKYIVKEQKCIQKEIKTTLKKEKIIILFLLLICVFYNAHNVYAFDYPSKPENYYVLDKADVLSVETEHLVIDTNSYYYQNKNIDSSLVTIADSVGDKKEYTKQLKNWWQIGTKNNGFIIAIYPESKDMVEIVIDDALKTYISNADVSRYKERIISGINNDNLDQEVKIIVDDMNILLKDYTKKDTFMETVKMVFDNLMFNLKPKEKTNVFGNLLYKVKKSIN